MYIDITNAYKPSIVWFTEESSYPIYDILLIQLEQFIEKYRPELYMSSSDLQILYDQIDFLRVKNFDGFSQSLLSTIIGSYLSNIYDKLNRIVIDYPIDDNIINNFPNEITNIQLKKIELLEIQKGILNPDSSTEETSS